MQNQLKKLANLQVRCWVCNLITSQTGPEGKKVNKVLIAQDVYYKGEFRTEEFYISILLNRDNGRYIVMYSPEGGMSIEEVAEKSPDLIFTEEIDPGSRIAAISDTEYCF